MTATAADMLRTGLAGMSDGQGPDAWTQQLLIGVGCRSDIVGMAGSPVIIAG